MSFQLSIAVRNARLDIIESTIGTSPLLKIFSGTEPINCAAADPSGVLISMSLPSDWMSAALSGSKTLLGTWSTSAIGTGIGTSFRIYNTAGSICHIQGNVTATGGGGDLTLDNTSIASGQTVTITTFTLTDGNV